MADTGLEEVIFDGPLHQVIRDGRTTDSLVVFDSFVIVAFQGSSISSFEIVLVCKANRPEKLVNSIVEEWGIDDIRFSVITVEPLSSFLVGFQRLLLITQFHLIHLCQILLLSGSTTEVAF